MGLNFYLKNPITSDERLRLADIALNEDIFKNSEWIIKLCKKPEIHIGKSSAGWRFLFNHNNWENFTNKAEMLEWLKTGQIVDEYNTPYSFEQFWAKVESKFDNKYNVEDYKKNPKYYIHRDGLVFSTNTNFF